MIRWENWLEVLRLFLHLFGLARVATDFLFYPKGKVKKHGKNLLRCLVGSGGRLWKGKVLAPFSSMVIHGLLVTCFRSLAFDFQLLEMVVCVCVFWKCFEKDAFVSATVVTILYSNVLQRCVSFRKDVSRFWKLFWKCVVECVLKVCYGVCFESRQVCFASLIK